jgi:hypothetical protein
VRTGLRILVGKMLFSPADEGGTAVLEPPAETLPASEAPADPPPEVVKPLMSAPPKPEEPAAEADPPEKKEEQDTPPPAVVPEKYELNLPENSLLDDDAIERTAALARDLGLSNEGGQKLLEKLNDEVSSRLEIEEKSRQPEGAVWNNIVREFNAKSLADPEIGGGNPEVLASNVAIAERAADEFFGPTIRQLLYETGFGSHPDVLRALVKIGKSMSEGSVIPTGEQKGGKKEAKDLLYGATAPKTES